MVELIRTTEDLPEWFKLDNYEKVAKFTTEELAEELALRALILRTEDIERKRSLFHDIEDYTLVANFPECEDEMSYEDWRSMFRSTEAIPKIDIFPELIPEEDVDPRYSPETIDQFLEEMNAYELKMSLVWRTSKLQPLDSRLIRATCLHDVDAILDYNRDKDVYRSDLGSPMIRLDDLLKQKNNSTVHLSLNLEATNTALCDELKQILPILRDHAGVNEPAKAVSDCNQRKLIQFKVMAYIDLFLWGSLYQKKVTDTVAACVLYKGQYGDEKIKDTVRPLALAALEPQFINTLKKKGENEEKKKLRKKHEEI